MPLAERVQAEQLGLDDAGVVEGVADGAADDDDYEPDNVQRYLADIGTHPLMTAEEERATAAAHACGRLRRATGNGRAQSASGRFDRQALFAIAACRCWI